MINTRSSWQCSWRKAAFDTTPFFDCTVTEAFIDSYKRQYPDCIPLCRHQGPDRIDSLDDLHFMDEPMIIVWTIVGSTVQLSAVDRTVFSHLPQPKMTLVKASTPECNQ